MGIQTSARRSPRCNSGSAGSGGSIHKARLQGASGERGDPPGGLREDTELPLFLDLSALREWQDVRACG